MYCCTCIHTRGLTCVIQGKMWRNFRILYLFSRSWFFLATDSSTFRFLIVWCRCEWLLFYLLSMGFRLTFRWDSDWPFDAEIAFYPWVHGAEWEYAAPSLVVGRIAESQKDICTGLNPAPAMNCSHGPSQGGVLHHRVDPYLEWTLSWVVRMLAFGGHLTFHGVFRKE